MLKRIVILLLLAITLSSLADTIWDYQAVNSDGTGSHSLVGAAPVPENKVTVEGVALAGMSEILDPNIMYTIFLQDNTSDRGGIQIWSGSFYYGSLWRPAEYIPFSAGDRVRVTGFLANNRGKVFINNRHSSSPDMIFSVEIVGHDGMPNPVLIPSISACNFFDATRETGGERYQTRWAMLHGFQITAGTWGSNNTMTIDDGTGSFPMLLSGMGDFSSYSQPSGKLSVVAIFDQEDLALPFHDSYRLWVKKYADIASALDNCGEINGYNVGDRIALVNKTVTAVGSNSFTITDSTSSIEVQSSHSVALNDTVCVQGVKSGANQMTAEYFIKQPAAEIINVTGTVNLNDIVGQNPNYNYKATLKIYKSGNADCNAPDVVKTADLDANGNYSFTVAPQGAGCTVVVKAGTQTVQDPSVRYHFLAKKLTGVDLSSNATLTTVNLPNGDINDDNIIDAFDFTILMQAYDIAEDTAIGQSDINNDGYVDAFDFTILMLSYDSAGDNCN